MRLQRARLADGRLVDIEVHDGLIAAITDAGADAGAATLPSGPNIDLDGWLVLAAMAEPHAHLDKALTADLVPNPAGDLMGAIDAWVVAAGEGRLTYEGTVERATKAMEMLLLSGVTAVRTHVNVGHGAGAASVRAVQEARDRFVGMLDVQLVALVSSPLTGQAGAGNRAALVAAVESGVDLLGGCPHLEPDPIAMIHYITALATEAALPLDLHVDEMLDPSVLTLRDYARHVNDVGFAFGSAASHCVTLGMQTPQVQAEVAAEVAAAGMSVFALPQTNLFLQARGVRTAAPRGLTALDALIEAGVRVGAGGDNVQDPFNVLGRSDPLETAALMVMAGHRTPEAAYAMVANVTRSALGLAPVNFAVGDPADFVAIDAPTVRAAIADAPRSRRTFRAGRLVASVDERSWLHRDP